MKCVSGAHDWPLPHAAKTYDCARIVLAQNERMYWCLLTLNSTEVKDEPDGNNCHLLLDV